MHTFARCSGWDKNSRSVASASASMAALDRAAVMRRSIESLQMDDRLQMTVDRRLIRARKCAPKTHSRTLGNLAMGH
eukprot:1154661-Pelagomonas_calceolata.AAC.6